MTRLLLVLMALVLLGTATQAPAACRRFGTQLECALGASQLLIGTQAAAEPAYARTLRPQLLQGGDGLLDDRPPPPMAPPARAPERRRGPEPLPEDRERDVLLLSRYLALVSRRQRDRAPRCELGRHLGELCFDPGRRADQ